MTRASMGTVTVHITHCIWRQGRPRFQPGPALRRLGFAGRDLKHPDGTWYSLAETEAFANEVIASAAGRRAQQAQGKRLAPLPRPKGYTVGALIDDALAARGKPAPDDGRQHRKQISPKTLSWYTRMASVLQQAAPDIWTADVRALEPPAVYGLYEQLDDERGLATARGVVATLSMAYKWGRQRGRAKHNPCLQLGLSTPKPQVRLQEPAELKHLIAAADMLGRPEIGDSIMLGLFSGQRQNDRLQMIDGRVLDGRLVLKQSKTGVTMQLRLDYAAPLAARLNAARIRRDKLALDVDYRHLVIDEQAGQPFAAQGDHYRAVFRPIAKAAAEGIRDEHGRWTLKPCPELDGFRDKHLRSQAVTWLARAGAEVTEIGAITGHELASIHQILRHYLGRHPELADHAIGRMVKWLEEKGVAL